MNLVKVNGNIKGRTCLTSSMPVTQCLNILTHASTPHILDLITADSFQYFNDCPGQIHPMFGLASFTILTLY